MISSVKGRVTIALLICSLLHVQAFAADVKEVIKNAQTSYYNLQAQGLKTFQCNVEPDWAKFLENVNKKPIPPDAPQLKMMKALRFSVSIDEQGQSKITPFMATGENVDPSLNQMIAGFQEMISGFYQTWTSMVLINPFPEAYESLALQQEGDGYRLSGKDGGSDVEIALNKSYVITEMKVTSKDSMIIVFPRFAKTDKGLLLTDIDSDINNGQQRVIFSIQYQAIQGLNLPNMALFKVTLPGQEIAVEMAFSKYQVTKR